MKIIIIESVVICLIFTLMVYIFSRDPIKTLFNYPTRIQDRIKSLDEYKSVIPDNKDKLSKKIIASIVIVVFFSLLLRYVNGYRGFIETFKYAYILWSIVNIYDVVVMDIIWFCHDSYFVIKGSEDMVDDYHDYLFHIRQGFIGQLIAIPLCLMIGVIVAYVLR